MGKEKRKADFWEKINGNVQCQLCPHFCFLKEGETGKCNARKNMNGELVSLVYSRPCSLAIDPIEKKPLHHFLPREKTLSIATPGCNLKCKNCQNWEISQVSPEKIISLDISPENVVKEAIKRNVKIIAYTYTEPTIFYEYMMDIAKIARKKRIKNVLVTNGFINPEPLKELCKYIDSANVDIKSINPDFYKNICQAKLEPVLESIRIMKEKGVWIELTNLLIPGLNDSEEDINKLADWVKKNLDRNAPIHFSAFYPCYKLINLNPTPEETIKKARRIALAKGLSYVYSGNIGNNEGNDTYCPKCKEAVIKRREYEVIEININEGKCSKCGEKISGVWC
ncbi:AmmeMemoRadiSam system radical SAM enzyme [Candidatus Pacearchaeota archaeon]|nr:AmmeMemoRadiSam system radical SAM enzyme [Candidatus Pacearchaeota archaeon]